MFGLALLTLSIPQPAGITPPVDARTECTAEAAQPASVSELSLAGAAAEGRCVAVTGWYDGRVLYPDISALYRERTLRDDRDRVVVAGVPNALHDRAVALRAMMVPCPPGGGGDWEVRLVCAAGAERFLWVAEATQVHGTPFVRPTLATRTADIGNLAPLAGGDEGAALRTAAAPLFAAMAARDEVALTRLLAHSQMPVPARFVIQAAEATTARWPQTGPELFVLGWRMPADATSEQEAALRARQDTEGVVCAADAAFAAARAWPVSSRDLSVHPDRPYVCALVWLRGEGQPARYDVRIARNIIPEP